MNKFLRDGVKESVDRECSQDEESEMPSEPHLVQPACTVQIDVNRIVNKLPRETVMDPSEASSSQEVRQAKESGENAVKSPSGQDTSKPPCKKAKLLRIERKQAKMAQRAAEGVPIIQNKPLKNVEKSLEDFLSEQPTDGKHKLKVSVERCVERSSCGPRNNFINCVEISAKFQVKLIPSSKGATEEALALYRKYQTVIHHDPPHKNTKESFVRFLCRSPLQVSIRFFLSFFLFFVD